MLSTSDGNITAAVIEIYRKIADGEIHIQMRVALLKLLHPGDKPIDGEARQDVDRQCLSSHLL